MEEIQDSQETSSGNLGNNERKDNVFSKQIFSLRNQNNSKNNKLWIIPLIIFIIIVIATIIFSVIILSLYHILFSDAKINNLFEVSTT